MFVELSPGRYPLNHPNLRIGYFSFFSVTDEIKKLFSIRSDLEKLFVLVSVPGIFGNYFENYLSNLAPDMVPVCGANSDS